MKFLIVFSLSLVCVFGRFVSRADNNILDKCADGIQEFTDCIKYKAIKLIDRAITNKKPIPIANFLYLTHDGSINGTANNVADEEDALKAEDVDNKLTEVLIRRVRMLTQTKNLQLKLDAEEEQSEGRKKDKNKGGQMTMLLGAGAMLMHMVMSKIALLAGKALIVAKIALVLSAVLALKTMTSDKGHDSTQVIYKSDSGHGGGGGGWQRSIDDVHAQQMAYGSQVHDHHP